MPGSVRQDKNQRSRDLQPMKYAQFMAWMCYQERGTSLSPDKFSHPPGE
jgi:hypothetical protein